MDAALNAGILAAAIGVASVVRGRLREEKRQAASRVSRAEARRRRECDAVLRQFRNKAGFLLSDAFPEGVNSVLDGGIAPQALARLIVERCQKIEGLTLGMHPITGENLPIILTPERRARHIFIQGKSGTGKTTLLRHLILSDLRAGRGFAALSPEAEFFETELLPFIPESRWGDVIYLNPSDPLPIPLNPLHLNEGEDLDLKVDETFTVFRRMFAEDGTGSAPRMEMILRKSLETVIRVGGTLLDIERLLDTRDDSYRTWAFQQISDERVRHFWTTAFPQFPKDATLPLLNRLERFLQSKPVRRMLCQPGRSVNLRRAMDESKVILVNASDGLLGEASAQTVGALVVAELQVAAMSRANIPPHQRRPFSLYLDEFQTYVDSSADSYERLLSRARKYRVSLTLANQQLGQIPEPILRQIFGNIGTLVSFRVSATDARRLSREFIGEIDGEPVPLDSRELLSLGVGEAWARIGETVCFMKTLPPPQGGSAQTREIVKERSRKQWAAPTSQATSASKPTVDLTAPGKVFS